jgi:hypothetical protein
VGRPWSERGVSTPANFNILDPPIFQQISTTATFSGNVEVCLPYLDSNQDGTVDLTSILETDLMVQKDTTTLVTTVDILAKVACVDVTSFREFALGVVEPVPALAFVLRLVLPGFSAMLVLPILAA